MAVQRIGRLEDGRRAPGPTVSQEQALQHLVGAVGAEHLAGVDVVVGGQGDAQAEAWRSG